MSFTMNLYYTGKDDSARRYAQEMVDSGIVDQIRQQPGCLRYDYFLPMVDPHTVLLIDSWESQEALDADHDSPMMRRIAELRDKYGLTVRAERYVQDAVPDTDAKFLQTSASQNEQE